jgi:outer membrane murein-binding lipoprotein Lpp
MNAVSQNTTFFYDTIILPYANITTTANIASLVVSGQSNLLTANLVTANVGTLNAVTAEFTSQMNALSANLVTANVGTLNAVTAGFTTQMNALSANLVTANIATANIGTENVVTLNAASIFTQNLNVAINSNVSNLVVTSNILAGPSGNTYITGNLVVSGNVFSNLGMPLGSGGGYYFSLSGDIALQTPYTGALYGATYPLSVGLSNGFTINGTSTLITVTTNGNFQFGVAGPYLLRAVFNSSDNITGLAVGSNIADQHGTDQNYMYRYTTFITQNPTELIEIPFNVTDVTKYYYLDLFSTDGGILRQTANTSGGTYLTITPLQGGGLATGGPGGTPGTQWINSGSNIYFSNSVGIGPINPQYNLDVIGNVHANSFISEVITGRTTAYTATPSDHYIGLSSGRSVTLPAGSVCPIGKMFIIKDEASNASVNSISLSTTDGDLIDGNSSVTLAINNISVTTLWTGTRWSLI